MSEIRLESIVDQLRSNLRGAGIRVTDAEIAEIVDRGFLKPVLAFERATKDIAMDLVPEYLSAWGRELEADELGESTEEAAAPVAGEALPSAAPPGGTAGGGRGVSRASELLDSSVELAARRLRSGEVSPLELVDAALERISARDPLINAFQVILADEARAAARLAEEEMRNGEYRGPLHGVPIAIKDILDVKGSPTCAGSTILCDRVAASDATAVARLRKAGAIIVGKTRMSEFAYSPGSNNDHYGPTRNPRSLERDTGGSSSGSAAAVADHMAFAALGTDTGGSIRIPSSFCGLVGLKPTYGRLSLHGSVSLAWSLDHLGPMARSVADVAFLMGILSGYDRLDPRSRKLPEPDSGAWTRRELGMQGLRIGVLRDDGSGRSLASEETLGLWRRGLDALRDAGAVLVDLDLPELQSLRAINSTILAIEAATLHLPTLRARLADYGDFPRLRLLAGWAYGPTDFIRAQQGHLVLRHRCDELFDRIDLLSTPTMPTEAPPLGTPARLSFTSPFNLLGWPALSLPVGLSGEGLPVGLQLVGRPWEEATVLMAARAVEKAIGFSRIGT
ncbi:MAG TPA: amidase [Rectinemataceae bacterium]|nr:amidase [Rectinemataceae bacterium]